MSDIGKIKPNAVSAYEHPLSPKNLSAILGNIPDTEHPIHEHTTTDSPLLKNPTGG